VLHLAQRDDRYRYPTSTTCIGNHGFVQCTTY
jgi:hypothetical protein